MNRQMIQRWKLDTAMQRGADARTHLCIGARTSVEYFIVSLPILHTFICHHVHVHVQMYAYDMHVICAIQSKACSF